MLDGLHLEDIEMLNYGLRPPYQVKGWMQRLQAFPRLRRFHSFLSFLAIDHLKLDVPQMACTRLLAREPMQPCQVKD